MAEIKLDRKTAGPFLSTDSGLLNNTCQRCPVCQEQLWSAKSQWIHRWLHTEKFYYECQICKEKFDEFETLKLHQQKYVENKGKFQREESYNGPTKLASSSPVRISDCNKEIAENGNQNRIDTKAIKTHAAADVKCMPKPSDKAPNVGKNEKYESDACLIIDEFQLEASKRKKSCNESPGETRTEPCYKCDMLFSNHRSLQDHLRQVHNEKMFYPCVHCGKTFTCHSSLSSHIEMIHKTRTYSKFVLSTGDLPQHEDNHRTIAMRDPKRELRDLQVPSSPSIHPLRGSCSSRHIPQSPNLSPELVSALPPAQRGIPWEVGTLKSPITTSNVSTSKQGKYPTNTIKPSIQLKERNTSTTRNVPLMTNSSHHLYKTRETAVAARKEFISRKEESLNAGGKISSKVLTRANDPSCSMRRRSTASNVLKFHLNFPNHRGHQSYRQNGEFDRDKRKSQIQPFTRAVTNERNCTPTRPPTRAIVSTRSGGYHFSEKYSNQISGKSRGYPNGHHLSSASSSYQFSDKSSDYQLAHNIYPSSNYYSGLTNSSRPINIDSLRNSSPPSSYIISRPGYINEYKSNKFPLRQSSLSHSVPTALSVPPEDWNNSYVSHCPKQGSNNTGPSFSGAFREEVFDTSCCSCQMNNLHTRDITKISEQQLNNRPGWSALTWHSTTESCGCTLEQKEPREEIDMQIGDALRGVSTLSYENNWPYFTHSSFSQAKQQRFENNNSYDNNYYYSGGNTLSRESTFLSKPKRDLLDFQRIYRPTQLQPLKSSQAEIISNPNGNSALNNYNVLPPKLRITQNMKTEIIAGKEFLLETLIPVKINSMQMQMNMFKMEGGSSSNVSGEGFKEINNCSKYEIKSENHYTDQMSCQKRLEKSESKILSEEITTCVDLTKEFEEKKIYVERNETQSRQVEDEGLFSSSEDKINTGTLTCSLPDSNASKVSIRCLICCALFMSEVDAKLHDVCIPEEIVSRKSSISLENELS